MNESPRKRFTPQAMVLLAMGLLMLLWLLLHLGRLISLQSGALRFFLTFIFSLAILLRPKPAGGDKRRPGILLSASIGGAVLAVAGLVFSVGQFEWLGLLLLCFGALEWALPARFSRDIPLALFLLYWAHPLPGQVFGPFQLAMQRWSVLGTEWLLHAFNVRVWADGLVLRTELTVCEVPAWCSGMRTAATVFLLALGLGILKRLKWYGILVFCIAAVAQALVLNVIRISLIVVLTPKLQGISGFDALHGTMHIVVILAAVLVYVELAVLDVFKRRRADQDHHDPQYGHDRLITKHPPFWQTFRQHRVTLLLVILGITLLAFIGYKHRTTHRMNMIADLTLRLIDAERYDEAQAALTEVEAFWPDDVEWKLTRVRLLLAQQRYEEVLEALDNVPASTPARATQKKVLYAYSLMGLNRLPEAADIVQDLPIETRQSDPRAAMILAEMAFYSDDPDEVAGHVVTAAKWLPNTERIRMLYPYLRTYRKWDAISDSDLKIPYKEPASALSAVEAYMNLNEGTVVAGMAIQAMASWPEDPRVLEPLFFLAIKFTHPKWETFFAEHLVRCANRMQDPDDIYDLFDKCVQLARSDLTWHLYNRIESLDPEHPALPLAMAVHGKNWLRFRRRFLGFAAARPQATLSIKPYVLIGACIPMYQDWLDAIPLQAPLTRERVTPLRKEQLQEALRRFSLRAAHGKLSQRMHNQYVNGLEMAGDAEGVRREIEAIATAFPETRQHTVIRLSEMYERRGEWQDVYETLFDYGDAEAPQLEPLLRLAQAERNLKLGICAIDTCRAAVALFPDSTRAASALADTLVEFDSAADALVALNQPRKWHNRDLDIQTAQMMHETQRFIRAGEICRGAMYPRLSVQRGTRQRLFLPPAELAILWRQVSLPSTSEFEAFAGGARGHVSTATSPFLKDMLSTWLDVYEGRRVDPDADIKAMEATGRNGREKATALNQYALLLCHLGDLKAARAAAARATTHMPQAPLLWRMLINLSRADDAVIARAREACPHDADVWLSELITRTRPPSAELTEPETAAAIAHAWDEATVLQELGALQGDSVPRMPIEAVTRAGEYLFRIGLREAASEAARYASAHAQSLLPAYVLTVKCALVDGDREWALWATKEAIRASLRPPPLFYKELIELRAKDESSIPIDSEMVEALRNLRRAEPANPVWAEMLGFVRFKRGGWDVMDALEEMTSALRSGSTRKRVFIIAAESSRLLDNFDRAVQLLRRGLELYPADRAFRNNLALALSQTKDGMAEALEMIDALRSEFQDDIEILDTAAMIHLHNGDLAIAGALAASILIDAAEDSDAAFRAETHRAEVALREGRLPEAREILERIVNSARAIPEMDLLRASDMLNETRRQLYEKMREARRQTEAAKAEEAKASPSLSPP